MANNTGTTGATRSTVAAGALLGAAAAVWAGRRIQEFARTDRPEGMVNWKRALEIALKMNKEIALTAAERALKRTEGTWAPTRVTTARLASIPQKSGYSRMIERRVIRPI